MDRENAFLRRKQCPDRVFEGSTDQITNFIARHNHQAGIQHIGFTCVHDIKVAVRIARIQGAQFLIPSSHYYAKVCEGFRLVEPSAIHLLQENNGRAIEAASENPVELAELGILLDSETDESCSSEAERR